jgi:tetratricopeptide (TPR) repeat protein
MIVRDEQDVLAQSIESVSGLADEVVILDTGSIDRTPLLAAELGAAVHRRSWENDFSAARNLCLRCISGNWVLWLDAGEQIASGDAARLRAFLDQEAKATCAYSLMIEVPPRDDGASAEQVGQFRLLPTNVGLRYVGRVRETVDDSIAAAGLGRAEAPCRILRDPRQHDADRFMAKARRDVALATAEAETSGKWPPRLLLAAGQGHSILGEQDQAREMLRQAIQLAPTGSPEHLEAYYGLLTTFDDDPEMHASQLTACLDSLQEFPFDLQLLLALGNYMLVRERLDLAIRAFDAAVRFGRLTPTVWHLCEAREIAAVCLSLALEARQRDDEARAVLETALSARPESLRLANQLQVLNAKIGKTVAAAGESRPRLRLDAGQPGVFSPHLATPQPEPVSG